MSSPAVPVSRPQERAPAALLPAYTARLGGFALLALVGVLEWRRMIDGLSASRALLWVLIAVGAAVAVIAAERLRPRFESPVTLIATLAALFGAYAAAGLELRLLKPKHWPELGDGLARGMEALSSVRMPYAGGDPWPALALQLLGAVLVVLAGLLAFWPRDRGRGYPFVALIPLLTLVAVPVVSLGGTRPLLLGGAVAGLVVAFLWLERLPLRPGLGVAALLGLALAGGVPLATMANREEPWFDYKSFAEGLGPDDPLMFSWEHSSYGPIDWPRENVEVMRVRSGQPLYWKLRTLEEFAGGVWLDEAPRGGPADPTEDLPFDWQERAEDTETLEVTIRRMRTSEVPGAGTTLDISDQTRAVEPSTQPGEWTAPTELRRGDSYSAVVHVPRPTGAQLQDAPAGETGAQREALQVSLPIVRPGPQIPTDAVGRLPRNALIEFLPYSFAGTGVSTAIYPTLGGENGEGVAAIRASSFVRTWRLARRLRRESETPYDLVRRVNAYLQDGFVYSENPPPVAAGVAPLDAFINDTKAGYCQHFSAAMAVLLRMGGVPARVATGFSPGGLSKRKGAWIVRDTDAHSWVEVWFDDYGWVTFDPTPSGTPARSQVAALQITPESDDDVGADTASGVDQAADRAAQNQRDRPAGAGAGADPFSTGGGPAWWLVALLVTGCLLVAGVALLYVQSRRRPLTADRAISELLVALRRTGRPPPPGATLTEIERRLGLSGDAADYVGALRAGRYGRSARPPQPSQRRALRRALAGRGPHGRLRAFWALPPRLR